MYMCIWETCITQWRHIFYQSKDHGQFNEGLPIKWPEKSFKMIFCSMEKIVGSALELSTKAFFSLDKYRLKIWVQTLFLLFNIKEIVNVFWIAFPGDQTNPFAYSRLHYSHYTHHIKATGAGARLYPFITFNYFLELIMSS